MRKMSSNEIRTTWLNFFKSKNHKVEEGASLIPVNDPTLLWINAGVAALKKYFDGTVIPQNPRICNVQKAIRTNDIENVGHTARHHTFFEMMGNFSIGDYFRNEAIAFAFELLTSENYFAIPIEKLYITYHPSDIATYNRWVEVGFLKEHLIPCEGNFWEIGTGPCGPDTEIFFDRGEKYDPNNLGVKLIQDEIENDRYIEIWNIVFSQYNSQPNLKRSEYQELPHKNIDTGAGLERFACVLQNAETNYETDLFYPIIKKCESLAKFKYENDYKVSYKIIADHLRTCTFALADGAVFSNEGRGYVLRRLLRRSIRHGKKIGIEGNFLAKLVDEVINIMHDFYPYLEKKSDFIKELITKEENKFLLTLNDGEKRLEELYNKNHLITGEDAFLLYDTYGFPFELTQEYASERNLVLNKQDFEKAMNKQKEMARNSRNKQNSMKSQNQELMDYHGESMFIGYDCYSCNAKIIKIFNLNNKSCVVLDKTPFYAEMGGEVSDIGFLQNDSFYARVVDCQKMPNGQHLHILNDIKGDLIEDIEVNASIDIDYRKAIEKNHSATHLMHQALKDVLGNHVNQHGSMVNDKYIRFDFNHFKNISSEELLKVEKIVKEKIAENIKVNIYNTSLENAKKENITALFDEKYGNVVRVVDMNYSKELCGGCHVDNTSVIEEFAISSIESKGSGIYRICAVTSNNALKNLLELNQNLVDEYHQLKDKYLKQIELLKNKNISISQFNFSDINFYPSYQTILNLKTAKEQLKDILKNIDKIIVNQKENTLFESVIDSNVEIKNFNDINYILKQVSIENIDSLKKLADLLANKYKKCLIILINIFDSKANFIVKLGDELINSTLHCGNFVKRMAQFCDGNGGGRKDMAQAGAKNLDKVSELINNIEVVFQ